MTIRHNQHLISGHRCYKDNDYIHLRYIAVRLRMLTLSLYNKDSHEHGENHAFDPDYGTLPYIFISEALCHLIIIQTQPSTKATF